MTANQMKPATLDKIRAKRIYELEAELGHQVVALDSQPRFAQLSYDQAQRLQTIESEFRVTLIAYEATPPLQLARPSPEQQRRLEAVERELGFLLLAYDTRQESREHYVPEQIARPAKLSSEQYQRLQTVEEETGLTLMAYESAPASD
jgi:uncharacterized protein YbaP (TraB family)